MRSSRIRTPLAPLFPTAGEVLAVSEFDYYAFPSHCPTLRSTFPRTPVDTRTHRSAYLLAPLLQLEIIGRMQRLAVHIILVSFGFVALGHVAACRQQVYTRSL